MKSRPADLSADDLTEFENTLSHVSGEFFPGLYDDWAIIQRETINIRLMESLELLWRARIERQQWSRALRTGHQLLSLDPLQEHVHRGLIRVFHRLGDQLAAHTQYRQCCKLLQDHLGVVPLKITKDAYFEGLSTHSTAAESTVRKITQENFSTGPVPEVSRVLDKAVVKLDAVSNELRQANLHLNRK